MKTVLTIMKKEFARIFKDRRLVLPLILPGVLLYCIYSLLGGEWKGRPGDHPYGEWIMQGNKIPLKEYSALAKAFNPILFDAKDWMKRARDAGMKYFVLTSKHHDGFALYHSRVSTYNVVDATPFRRDVVGELAEA